MNYATVNAEAEVEVETIVDPSLWIVDAHHHLFDRPGLRYLAEEFVVDVESGHNIGATVYIDCRSNYRDQGPELYFPVGEAEFVAEQAALARQLGKRDIDVCAAMSGRVDLTAGEAIDDVLAACQEASGGRLRGIRNTVAWDAGNVFSRYQTPPGLLLDLSFRAGVARLARHDLLFEAWAYHPQLPELIDLAHAVPQTQVVVNHCGGPLGAGTYGGHRDEVFEVWRGDIRRLAEHENIYIKLGGLGMPLCGFGFDERGHRASPAEAAEAWRPYFETCVDAFGTDRCMFESNFPPDAASISYRDLWSAFKLMAAGFSDAEKRDLFSETATRLYRLSP